MDKSEDDDTYTGKEVRLLCLFMIVCSLLTTAILLSDDLYRRYWAPQPEIVIRCETVMPK